MADLDRIVYAYLKGRGYSGAQEALERESNIPCIDQSASGTVAETGVATKVAAVTKNLDDFQPDLILQSYKTLSSWIETSLDQYRTELYSITFPIFVHFYIDLISRGYCDEAARLMDQHGSEHTAHHASEIGQLKTVRLPDHLARTEIVDVFRKGKYHLQLCSYSKELLMSFLQEHKFMAILGTINQHINIESLSGKPRRSIDVQGILGATDPTSQAVNKKAVLWGELPVLEEEDEEEEEGADVMETDKDKQGDEAKKKKPKKKARLPQPEAPERTRIPLPSVRGREYEIRLKALEQTQRQVALTATALPSACFYTLFNAHENVNCLTFSDDTTLLAGGFADSQVRVWDLTERGLRTMLPADQIDGDRTWDELFAETTEPFKTLYGHSGPVYAVQFSPDNQFLLSCSEDTTVRLWSLLTFTNVVCYRGHNYPVWHCSFSPFGHYFATASHDRTARVWTTEQTQPLRILAGHLSDVDVVEFHPNGNYVATGSTDRSVRLWDMQSGECVRILQGHLGTVFSLAFSPNGHYLASSGEDGVVVLWDLAAARKVKALHAHTNAVHNLSFCFGNTLLASGGLEGRICLWDVAAATRVPDYAPDEDEDEKDRAGESAELLKSYYTKMTPVTTMRFSQLNLLLAAGVFHDPAPPTDS